VSLIYSFILTHCSVPMCILRRAFTDCFLSFPQSGQLSSY